jgi:hypothetical protein
MFCANVVALVGFAYAFILDKPQTIGNAQHMNANVQSELALAIIPNQSLRF